MITWAVVKKLAYKLLDQKHLSSKYLDRLNFEINEIDKQGASRYWVEALREDKKFSKNPNKLLLPWLLGLCIDDADIDPYNDIEPFCTTNYHDVVEYSAKHDKLPIGIYPDRDQPDIDLDCLPEARDEIKEYASQRYGSENVCSVGTMNSYLLKQAILDCVKALGLDKSEAMKLTTELPDAVNDVKDGGYGVCNNKVIVGEEEVECKTKHNKLVCPKCGSSSTETPTFVNLLEEHESLKVYYNKSDQHKHAIDTALGLLGRYKSLGKHAGALIIANCNLFGNVPMYKKNNQWVSMWTEGRSPQLSKFGYNKWDVLGLKNLKYIFECCKLIERNHGISFGDNMVGMDENDPSDDTAAVYWKDGVKHKISLNDPKAIELAAQQKVDAVFQFDTELAKSILANGVRNFNDLLTFNAMGHPGPLQSIPEYVKRRDDEEQEWREKEHPLMASLLEKTYGILVYQEDLAAAWQNIAGFTATEAQEARKAVAKKWKEKLKPVEAKWIEGASPVLGLNENGESWARLYWEYQVTFGRYAFNKCLSGSTPFKDVTTGEVRTVSEWFLDETGYEPHFMSYKDGVAVPDKCVDIHYTYEREIYEVEFSDGGIEYVTSSHRFMCEGGQYLEISKIVEGDLKIQAVDGPVSVVKFKFHSVGPTYAVEMDGEQHNYVTESSKVVHKNSHAVSYCLTAYKCLWLKAHFSSEWWASVMSHCHPDKLPRYMSAARQEGTKFSSHNINFLTVDFTSDGAAVSLGLSCLKKVGKKMAIKYADTERVEYTDIDDFINKKCYQSGSKTINKLVMERLIRLGAFKKLHPNAKATWEWYQYKYVRNKAATANRRAIQKRILEEDNWTEERIEETREKMIKDWKALPANKNKRKVPNKFLIWKPKPNDTRERVMSTVSEDYTLQDLLKFEKEYLGYLWHSPLDAYVCQDEYNIEAAKVRNRSASLHCVVMKCVLTKTKNDKEMAKLTVMDARGYQAMIIVWENIINYVDKETRISNRKALSEGNGVHLFVNYDDMRNTFTLACEFVQLLPFRGLNDFTGDLEESEDTA